ncbi:MAG: STAS domain-containing protein [bacterium]
MASTAPMHFNSARFEIARNSTSQQAKELRSRVRQSLEEGERHLVVDCEAWQQLDLSVLSSLIQCAAACKHEGASFEVANLSSTMQANVRALQLGGRLGLAD